MFLNLSEVLIVSCVFWFALGQLVSKSNVAFVIDSTGSMKKDIESVKSKALQLFTAVLETKNCRIDKFILITFNDKTVQDIKTRKYYEDKNRIALEFLTSTRDPQEFVQKLSAIKVDGGGDCAELSLNGVKEAVSRSNANSFIYVFTDASAKDYYLTDEVIATAQNKSIQINFLLTGTKNSGISCPEDNLPENSVDHYTKIANATTGEVFTLRNRNDIRDLINYIINCIRSPQTTLQTVPFNKGVTNININPDSDMKNVSVSVGVGRRDKVDVNITDEHGNDAQPTTLVNKPNLKIYKVENPNGTLITTVNSTGKGTATIKAAISIDFMYGFSGTNLATSMKNTRTRPIADQDSYLYVKLIITDADSDADLEQVTFLSNIDDKEIKSMAPLVVNEQEKLYITSAFKPPEDTFKVAITAVIKNTGEKTIRKAPTFVMAQKPPAGKIEHKQATVTIEQGLKIKVNYEDSLVLECKVNAYPEPIIVWQNEETGKELPSTTSTIDHPYDYLSVLMIDKLKKDTVYKCEAHSSDPKLHSASTSINVEIDKPHFWKILEIPQDTTIGYKSNGKIFCKVDAWPPSKISWHVGDKKLSNDDNFHISDDTTTLEIKNMQPELKGLYHCIATNDDYNETFPFTISLNGVALPEIDTSNDEYTAKQGDKETILCRVVKGIPEPEISWDFKRNDSDVFIEIPNTGSKIALDPVKVEDAGVYRCCAKNIVGKTLHDITLSVLIPPELDKSESVKAATQGSQDIISCRILKGNPKPEISWKIKREGENDFTPIANKGEEIRLDAVSLNDAGVYQCHAENIAGNTFHEITVTVQTLPEIDTSNDEYTAKQDDKETILCRVVKGIPEPEISWELKRNDSDVFIEIPNTGPKIALDPVKVEDAGVYRCCAKNIVGKTLHDITLSVLIPPELDKSESVKAATQGSQDIISCRILKGNPEPEISWKIKRDGENDFTPIANKGEEIRLDAVSLNDAGVYQCHAENIAGNTFHEITVTVQSPPEINKTEHNYEVKQGFGTDILCSVLKGIPKPDIRWEFKRNGLSNFVSVPGTNQEFRIDLADEQHAGIYRCWAKNSLGQDFHDYELTVQYRPEIYKAKNQQNVTRGFKAVIPCRILRSLPKAKITWEFRAKGKTEFESRQESGEEIVLEASEGKDSGTYRCTAENLVGKDSNEYTLDVHYGPKIDKMKTKEIATKDSSVVLSCRILEGNPTPAITWEFKRKLATEYVDLPETTQDIRIDAVDLDSAGYYKCHAKNEEDKDYHEMELIVKYGPTVVVEQPKPSAVDAKVMLSCDAKGNPKPTVKWLKDGTLIEPKSKYRILKNNYLSFTAELKDSGNYTCVAENVHGKDEENVTLIVYEPVKIQTSLNSLPSQEVGSDLELVCRASGYPPPTITWKFFCILESLNVVLDSKDPVLILKRLQPRNAGLYMCFANNEFSNESFTYGVDVKVPVSVEILPPEQTDFVAIEGDLLLRIPCKAKGYPKPIVSWSLNNYQLVMGNGQYGIDSDDSLLIYNPDSSMQGHYKCTAESSDEKVIKTASSRLFKVTVSAYPIVSGPVEKLPIEEGSTSVLNCKVRPDPTDTIRWYKDGKQIEVNPLNGQLLLKQATKYASGLYTCRLSSSLRSESAHVEVVVGSKPKFKHNKRDEVPDKELVITVPFVFGRELYLDCLAVGTPTPTVTWYRNNQIISENPVLQFKTTDADVGIKRCEAKNDFGTIARSYEIKETGCIINFLNLDPHKYHPLLVNHRGKLNPFENRGGEMIVPEREPIDAVCPNGNITQVYCSSSDFVVMETSKHYSYQDIQCTTQMQITLMEVDQCTDNEKSRKIQVGYQMSSTSSYIYEVCLNVETSIPYFTMQQMNRYASDIEVNDQVKYNADYTLYSVEDIYDCGNQKCCFSKKQLVTPMDVTPAAQKATFYNINVIPQWNLCGNLHNWDDVEKRIRKLAKSIEHELTIYSGGYKYKTIRNKNGKYIDAPDYIWKVVQIDEREEALAIISINMPNLKAANLKNLVFCKDICAYTDWMDSSSWKKVENGYIFCCSPKDFARKVNKFFLNLFKMNTLKLKDGS